MTITSCLRLPLPKDSRRLGASLFGGRVAIRALSLRGWVRGALGGHWGALFTLLHLPNARYVFPHFRNAGQRLIGVAMVTVADRLLVLLAGWDQLWHSSVSNDQGHKGHTRSQGSCSKGHAVITKVIHVTYLDRVVRTSLTVLSISLLVISLSTAFCISSVLNRQTDRQTDRQTGQGFIERGCTGSPSYYRW